MVACQDVILTELGGFGRAPTSRGLTLDSIAVLQSWGLCTANATFGGQPYTRGACRLQAIHPFQCVNLTWHKSHSKPSDFYKPAIAMTFRRRASKKACACASSAKHTMPCMHSHNALHAVPVTWRAACWVRPLDPRAQHW
jgi:hypothetical protein